MDNEREVERELGRLGSWSSWAGEQSAWPVSSSGVTAVDWAVEVHRSHYGDAMLQRALLNQPPHPFVEMGRWPLSTPGAVVSLLARACSLTLLSEEQRAALVPKSGKAPNRSVISELEVLEIAGLAIADGWHVNVETALPSGRRPDLSLVRDNEQLCIEVSRIGPDRERRKVEAWTQQVVSNLMPLASKWSVGIVGEAQSAKLVGEELERFLARVQTEAERSAASGHPYRLREAGLAISIDPSRADTVRFDGPPLSGDMWTRLKRRLVDKAYQTEGEATAWIYLHDWSGLFQLTNLAFEDESEQLRRLAENITVGLADFPHLAGVLLSTGIKIDSREIDHDTMLDDPCSGLSPESKVLRRRLPAGRCRRTFIVRLGENASAAASAPQEWFEDEGSWLAGALKAVGQPDLQTILKSNK